jgi:hypothetical protein
VKLSAMKLSKRKYACKKKIQGRQVEIERVPFDPDSTVLLVARTGSLGSS